MLEESNAASVSTTEGFNALDSMRPVVRVGIITMAVFFIGFGGWAAFASLQSAAIAPGEVGVESNRKTIQHLEGGIVEQILVQEGEAVKAGQVLIRLQRTQSDAALQQLQNRYYAALALQARLQAERDRVETLIFPAATTGDSQLPETAQAMQGERNIFIARRASMKSQQNILHQRITQFEKEMQGLRAQLVAEQRQLDAIDTERRSQQKLVDRKLSGMQRLLELQRDEAEIAGSRARHRSDLARAAQRIGEERLKIIDLQTTRNNEVASQLRETQALVFELGERTNAAKDVLTRTDIRAPRDGVVVQLSVHTIGGVIAPGEALLDIVPKNERLIVQARVKPEDIDSVHRGLLAQVTLTAFSRRNVAPVEGKVISVSADRLNDKRSGEAYFLARIQLPEQPYEASRNLDLYPGMQAEVMILTGEESPLNYILRPALQSFGRAMKES